MRVTPIRQCILFICNDSHYFRQHRLHLAERMVAEGLDVHVASGGGPLEVAPGMTFHPIDVERFRFSIRRDAVLFRQLRALVERLKPDVIHIITMKPAVVASSALTSPGAPSHRPSRIVVTFPGLGRLFEGRSLRARLRQVLAEFFLRRLLHLPSAVATFENPTDLAFFTSRKLVPADRAVLTNGAGLDLDKFASVDRKVGNRPFRALWAGRMLRSKGLYEFLEAAELSSRAGSSTEFWIAGYADEGNADALTRQEIAALSANTAINYRGHVLDMPSLLAEVDALVLPSRYNEGLPRILIEAAAARLTIVGSDIPGIRQIIDHGVTGFLLPAISGPAVLDSVNAIARDPATARQLGDAAHDALWRRGFHEQAIQAAFLAAYGVEATAS